MYHKCKPKFEENFYDEDETNDIEFKVFCVTCESFWHLMDLTKNNDAFDVAHV